MLIISGNSTIFIQEAHNYIDSRNSMSKRNKALSYWILQSRHTGKGSCDIIYDTQSLSQVDIRLRRNTDHILHPSIRSWEITGKNGRSPKKVEVEMYSKIGHEWRINYFIMDVSKTKNQYDTHELVDF